MAVSIELFYDCLSPFSYLAFTVLERYQPVWEVDLRLRPLLLGGVMGATKVAHSLNHCLLDGADVPPLQLLVSLLVCLRCSCSCHC
jgi:hypothetical protein